MSRHPAVGLRLIIAYKAIKAAVQAVLAAALLVLRHAAVTARLAAFTTELSEHLEHAWTAALARMVAALLTPNHLMLVSLALVLDAALSAFEGWALHRRFRWAPWLVVVAGASLIPFEIVELLRKVRPLRIVVLIVNLAIIGYLLVRARRESQHNESRHHRA
jgi:uncharacterized membrane protein (DUF2068 family)